MNLSPEDKFDLVAIVCNHMRVTQPADDLNDPPSSSGRFAIDIDDPRWESEKKTDWLDMVLVERQAVLVDLCNEVGIQLYVSAACSCRKSAPKHRS